MAAQDGGGAPRLFGLDNHAAAARREREDDEPRVQIFVQELADIIWGDPVDEPESFGKLVLDRFFFARSTNPYVKLILAVWTLVLLAAGTLRMPGLVYVVFMLIPVIASWLPTRAEHEHQWI